MNPASVTIVEPSNLESCNAQDHLICTQTKSVGANQGPALTRHWKKRFESIVWSDLGPKGVTSRSVLWILARHAEENGRVPFGRPTIAKKAGISNVQTVRNALKTLVADGWIFVTPEYEIYVLPLRTKPTHGSN